MAKKMKLKETKKLLRRIVNEVGHEYTYDYEQFIDPDTGRVETADSCLYTTEDGKPSCIVGHAVAEVAPAALKQAHTFEWHGEHMTRYQYPESDTVTGMDGDNGRPDYRKYFDEASINLLNRVQLHQDSGHSWGDALDKAFKMF